MTWTFVAIIMRQNFSFVNNLCTQFLQKSVNMMINAADTSCLSCRLKTYIHQIDKCFIVLCITELCAETIKKLSKEMLCYKDVNESISISFKYETKDFFCETCHCGMRVKNEMVVMTSTTVTHECSRWCRRGQSLGAIVYYWKLSPIIQSFSEGLLKS